MYMKVIEYTLFLLQQEQIQSVLIFDLKSEDNDMDG